MNRSTPPSLVPLQDFDYLKAVPFLNSNNCDAFYINGTEQEITKIEFVFQAGYKEQDLPMQAAAVNKLLLEGTKKRTSLEIASLFDNLGAFIDTNIQADYASLVLHCLNRHVKKLLPIVIEIIHEASFPEDEFQDFKNNKKNSFLINQEKVSFLAKNEFARCFFGENHPYNNSLKKEYFESISREDLVSFYHKTYLNNKLCVLVSGKVNNELIQQIVPFLNSFKGRLSNKSNLFSPIPQSNQEQIIEKENAQQSAIIMGLPMPQKGELEFPSIFIANTLLGGYFGSRLMTNLREEKGYTYGVGSGVFSNKEVAYWMLSTEVGVEHTVNSLREIQNEMNRLSEENVPEDELELVKSYFQGSMMRNFDGPFQAMDRFKSLYTLGLDYSYYDQMISEVKRMKADDLKNTFTKYFTFENSLKIIAGKKV